MEWMTRKQKEDFETVCLLIDSIDSPNKFYLVKWIMMSFAVMAYQKKEVGRSENNL